MGEGGGWGANGSKEERGGRGGGGMANEILNGSQWMEVKAGSRMSLTAAGVAQQMYLRMQRETKHKTSNNFRGRPCIHECQVHNIVVVAVDAREALHHVNSPPH